MTGAIEVVMNTDSPGLDHQPGDSMLWSAVFGKDVSDSETGEVMGKAQKVKV